MVKAPHPTSTQYHARNVYSGF